MMISTALSEVLHRLSIVGACWAALFSVVVWVLVVLQVSWKVQPAASCMFVCDSLSLTGLFLLRCSERATVRSKHQLAFF